MKNIIFNKTIKTLSPFNIQKSKNPHLRVADILAYDDDDDDVGDDGDDNDCAVAVESGGMDRQLRDRSTSSECPSVRRIIVQFLGALRRGKERRTLVKSQKTEKQADGPSTSTRRSMNGMNGGDTLRSVSECEESGQCRKDGSSSFNLGVGCGLLYLIAVSKNEFAKMMELRTQMEMLLQNVKEELQEKDALFKQFESNDTLACSTSDVQLGSNSNSRLSLQLPTTSHVLPDSETIMAHDQPLKYTHQHVEGIDELEAELEAELERLQICLDSENPFKHPQQQIIKDAATERNRSLWCGEVIDPQDADTEVHHGVPPVELERRLHELLEARQEEQIRELEAALECTRHKLHEKETEVSWWKDTAQLISRHVPGPS